MELFVDPGSDQPLTTQLYEQIRDAIVAGRLEPGDRLAATRTVAADLKVSRSTVTEAYGRLSAEGYLTGRSGGGSVVATLPTKPARRRAPAADLKPVPAVAAVRPYRDVPGPTPEFDMRPGRGDPALFPTADWRRCMLRALDHPPARYGNPAGTLELRAALAHWINRSRGVTTTADEIVVTSGAGHAVDLIARMLPGAVAVEEPGYPPVVSLLRMHGRAVVGVPVDEQGLVVDAIPANVRLVYVTPSHQYPLGVPMSRARRLELLRWAGAHGAAIIEDDYDSEFRHTARPLEPLHRLDGAGRVIYVGTFSKTLSPALRLGFLVAPPALIPGLCALRQMIDWSPPLTTQVALTHLIRDGHLDRHLRRSRTAYRLRHRLLRDALAPILPDGWRMIRSEAGLHFTIVGPRAAEVLSERLVIGSLARTYHFTAPTPGLVVGFGALHRDQIPAAAEALVAAHETFHRRRTGAP